jgi:hypothetical protein
MHILGLTSLLLLAACSPAGKGFCLKNGYVEDTPGYEGCTERFWQQRGEYIFCTGKRNLWKENKFLDECLTGEAQLAQQRFVQDRSQCSIQADRHMDSLDNGLISAVDSIISALGKSKKLTKEDEKAAREEEDRRSRERENRKNSLINDCMYSKGWQDPQTWYNNGIIPGASKVQQQDMDDEAEFERQREQRRLFRQMQR